MTSELNSSAPLFPAQPLRSTAPAQLSTEQLLARAASRAATSQNPASGSSTATESSADPVWRATEYPPQHERARGPGDQRPRLTALERGPDASARDRIRRAVGTPLGVGVVAFVAAVVIAIIVAVLQVRGAQAPGSGAASTVANVVPGTGGRDTYGSEATGAEARGDPGDVGDRAAGSLDTVIVHVAGEVLTPGIVELAAGSRVIDAVEQAGGASEAAVLTGVNLARLAVDGEQIVVPGGQDAGSSSAVPGAAPGALPPVAAEPLGPGTLSLNTASAAELETLPRVGPALAARIIEWRTEHGPFASVDALTDVPGIGAKTLDGFRARVSP
ncbi:ComEA family DNA-binding protein [Leucobacter sp. 7(1)]|uniref:ComEA family DNA-binding protein n=1 Tax=Leucobacter sp. 7(1) TaxID=1255613 RepID=UPI0015954CAD|nr:ComEA family DNA-binding protein [Leucobacter sp. 7(1)]